VVNLAILVNHVKDIESLLPTDVFSHIEQFRHGLAYATDSCDIGIYAKKEPLLGEKGIMLIAVNEHLFGDPNNQYDNPFFKLPEGATNIMFISSRELPHNNMIYTGVQFTYREAKFLFGYESRNNSLDGKLSTRNN